MCLFQILTNNLYSDEEFSLLISVEHSPKRKIRLHKVHLPQKKILDVTFSKTHSLVVFSGDKIKSIAKSLF